MPPELRVQIWEEALSGWSVLAVNHVPKDRSRDGETVPLPKMTFVGHAPCLAGATSREARRVMKQCYGEPIPTHGTSAANAGVYWVNLEKTLVYLGYTCDAKAILDNLAADDLARLEHIIVLWDGAGGLGWICLTVAEACPSLRTVIVQRVTGGRQPCRPPLQPAVAAYYLSLIEAPVSEQQPKSLGLDYRLFFLRCFTFSRPPMFHLLNGEPPGAMLARIPL